MAYWSHWQNGAAHKPCPSPLQATLLRYHSQLHEAFVHAQRAELRLESSTRVHRQKFAPHTVRYICAQKQLDAGFA